ncbi:WXG100 family type VII secretion target, partial [Streptomyces sp. NPDC006283]
AQAWLHEVVTTGHANYAEAHRAVLRGWGAA